MLELDFFSSFSYLFSFFIDCFVDKVHVEASRAIHVGDNLQADKIGANAIGIECW